MQGSTSVDCVEAPTGEPGAEEKPKQISCKIKQATFCFAEAVCPSCSRTLRTDKTSAILSLAEGKGIVVRCQCGKLFEIFRSRVQIAVAR